MNNNSNETIATIFYNKIYVNILSLPPAIGHIVHRKDSLYMLEKGMTHIPHGTNRMP